MAGLKYLWYQGIDIEQDAVIQAALVDWKKTTGAIVNQNVMLKIIVMEYGKRMQDVNREIDGRNKARKLGEFLCG